MGLPSNFWIPFSESFLQREQGETGGGGVTKAMEGGIGPTWTATSPEHPCSCL